MNFEILTLFPAMLEVFFSESILGRARESGAVRVACTDIRAYTRNKHRRVDDTPYGGGYGMVLACQPVVDCLRAVKSRLTGSVRTIYLSPQGGLFTHRKAKELASYDNLVLLCGHYEGVDERILELEVDEELSVGDYVLTGGELPAAIVVDAVARLVDGVLPAAEVHTDEASSPGCWSIPSIRVRACSRRAVPDVLLGGDHEEIRKWRLARAFERTLEKRPSCWNC
ncbi:MAG: tRNA (guanosine(37)-N1)-methyltransferase TrmD [Acutalibacteraceae bacterium]